MAVIWYPVVDSESGYTYYVNSITKESAWEIPDASQDTPPVTAASDHPAEDPVASQDAAPQEAARDHTVVVAKTRSIVPKTTDSLANPTASQRVPTGLMCTVVHAYTPVPDKRREENVLTLKPGDRIRLIHHLLCFCVIKPVHGATI